MKVLSTLAVPYVCVTASGMYRCGCQVGTAAVGTKAATDPRSVGTQVDDGTLELRVNSALSKDEQIKERSAYQRDGLSGQSAAGRSRCAEPERPLTRNRLRWASKGPQRGV